MRFRRYALCLTASLVILGCGMLAAEEPFDAARAFEHLKTQVSYGPRLIGSDAHAKTRAYFLAELKSYGLQAEELAFVVKTPKGEMKMFNIVATLPGKKKESIVLGSHFDTKDIGQPPCPGACDGASSSGLLLELARVLQKRGPQTLTYRFAFFDGEESIGEWSEADSLRGSKDLVARWVKDGTLGSVKAMINFDMIGDKDLHITRESLSSSWLVDAFRKAAKELGNERHFFADSQSIEDDHRPFLAAGIPALDLIDTNYGPADAEHGFGAHWHTAKDTVENCSPDSLKVVGETALRALAIIQKQIP